MLARTNTYLDSPFLDNTSIRIDHAVNERLAVFGRYSEAPSRDKASGGKNAPGLHLFNPDRPARGISDQG